MNYRAEIDGLRAIAVLSIIFYHAEFIFFGRNWFEGGYIGVDIFFVISGYLITRIILSELFTKDSFSILNFYERRVRRILPVLFTVILVSFPFAWQRLLPGDFVEYSQSILSTMFFGSNIFFYFSTIQYGAGNALLKPFLHTWSLGIEEQFYIVFPILLLFFYKFLRNHILTIFVAMILVSLQLSGTLSFTNPIFNFYLLISRFWELLVGSVLAYYELKYKKIQNSIASQILPIFGLFLIMRSILVSFDSQTPHPSFVTLTPLVGVALIIVFSSTKDLVGKVLASKPFVAIGLVSYSAYLWHFPIFAFSRLVNSLPSNYDKLGWIALTFILSIISYFLIERPFRDKRAISLKMVIASLLLGSILIIALQGLALRTGGFKERIPSALIGGLFFPKPLFFQQAEKKCIQGEKNCVFDNSNPFSWVHFIGDSHAESLSSWGKKRFLEKFNLSNLIISSCWPILETQRFDVNGVLDDEKCTVDRQSSRIRSIFETNKSIVVIAGRLPLMLHENHFNNKEGGVEVGDEAGAPYSYRPIKHSIVFDRYDEITLERAIQETILKILNRGHSVILVYPIPEVGWSVPHRLMEATKKPLGMSSDEWLLKHPISTSYEVYLERTKTSFDLLDDISHKNLYRIYPHELVCDRQVKGRCVVHDNEHPFYIDYHHPSVWYAEMINDLIMEKIDLIVNK